jgi:hypothetical protein
MRLALEISRCKCPRCVAARRMRFAAFIAVCIIFVCGWYIAFHLPQPKDFKSLNLTVTPKTLTHSAASAVAAGAQPLHSSRQSRSPRKLSNPRYPPSITHLHPPEVLTRSREYVRKLREAVLGLNYVAIPHGIPTFPDAVPQVFSRLFTVGYKASIQPPQLANWVPD